ncbi:flavin reductase [Reticulibacter mediterranei]|uniref:Flavin reductase n=1 Tax=Reticulibacter mediterranei TaxID=2778369 RepID=A0A8J3N600_9CHLR|nr:flavin reductase family protein [Reticulibacter mediterranei]GHO96925.1 flavin reductase [Reticulibacter mediterranei]
MAIEKDFFRQVMGRFATGVTVVTTKHEETLAGLTVNAFCSVSLNPPLILVCIDLNSQAIPLIRASQSFAVNMLTAEQEYLSRCFSTHSEERFDRFCHASYHTAVTGVPILDGSLAFIDARMTAEYPGGDHAIFVGQVVAMGMGEHAIFAEETDKAISTLPPAGMNGSSDDIPPLVYYKAQYRHLGRAYHHPSEIEPTEHAEKHG